MSAPPGSAPIPSTTVYPAEQWSRNSERRVVSALVSIGASPAVARAAVRARIGLGEAPDEVEAYLRATFHMDPTGVRAVRNVMKGAGRG